MFYKSISEVYDYIFPQNKKQQEFIHQVSPILKTDRILDIGCATGNLTELLARCSDHVSGLDLDEGLLEQANKKYPTLDFTYGNMLNIKSIYDETFDKIVSFGNTLVHLPSRDDVITFFNKVYESLNMNGSFICQIINYDRIYNDEINHLPTIDNEHIKFVRDYVLHENHVDFNTTLTIKENNQVTQNSIPLLNLKKDEIEKYLVDLGYKDINFYGALNGKKLESTDIPLIFTCRK